MTLFTFSPLKGTSFGYCITMEFVSSMTLTKTLHQPAITNVSTLHILHQPKKKSGFSVGM